MSLADNPASLNARRTGSFVRSTKSNVNWSNLARVNVTSKCNGPASPAVMNGKLICVEVTPDKSFLAFSAASFKRCIAILSCDKSIPLSRLNSATKNSIILLSKSSPPKWLSPDVDNTSNTPSPNSKIDTSNVPPPKSNTKIFSSWSTLSKPYAKAAAVGSFTIRSTSKPAIRPASLVA